MTSAGIGTTKNVADPLTLADEELLWSSGTIVTERYSFIISRAGVCVHGSVDCVCVFICVRIV
jgi:hypothetical protein